MGKQRVSGLGGVTPPSEMKDVNRYLVKGLEQVEGTPIVAKPILLDEILPDMRQPRRAIPLAVRRKGERTIGGMLRAWQEMVGIDAVPLLMAGGEGFEVSEYEGGLVADFVDLCKLANSILQDGLDNPISVASMEGGEGYLLESGERRLLAHHLLKMYVDADKYGRIAARVLDRHSVWRQASENGTRSPLNAIGLARQLALLIMDMYPADSWRTYDEMVGIGQCDRAYYAQVAEHRIARGYGQRVLTVTGLKSMDMVQKYRRLLTIPDAIWDEADIGNWTEWRIRGVLNPSQEGDTLTTVRVSEDKGGDTVTTVTVSGGDNPFARLPRLEEVRRDTVTTVTVSGDGDGIKAAEPEAQGRYVAVEWRGKQVVVPSDAAGHMLDRVSDEHFERVQAELLLEELEEVASYENYTRQVVDYSREPLLDNANLIALLNGLISVTRMSGEDYRGVHEWLVWVKDVNDEQIMKALKGATVDEVVGHLLARFDEHDRAVVALLDAFLGGVRQHIGYAIQRVRAKGEGE